MEKELKPFSEEKAEEIMKTEEYGYEERNQAEQYAFEAGREDMAEQMKKGEEMLLETERRIEKIEKGVKIEIETHNPFYEGSDPYNKVEKFFSEELPKYDLYIRENIVKILSNASCDREGYVRLPILDKAMLRFYGSWEDPMNPEDGFVIKLSGGESGGGIVGRWIINFTLELSAEIQQFGPQFAILGGDLVKE